MNDSLNPIELKFLFQAKVFVWFFSSACLLLADEKKQKPIVWFVCFFFVFVQKWRELWQKSDYEDWLYRRPQLPVGASDDDCNSIYELPERVSSSRPVSTYYSSATILASDSAVYSAYYWSLSFFCSFHFFPWLLATSGIFKSKVFTDGIIYNCTNCWNNKYNAIKIVIDWPFIDEQLLLLNKVDGLVVSNATVRSGGSSSAHPPNRWASSAADWMDLPCTSYGEMQ